MISCAKPAALFIAGISMCLMGMGFRSRVDWEALPQDVTGGHRRGFERGPRR